MPYEDSHQRRKKEKTIQLVAVVVAVLIAILAYVLLTKGRANDASDLEKDEAYRRGLYDRNPFETPEDED